MVKSWQWAQQPHKARICIHLSVASVQGAGGGVQKAGMANSMDLLVIWYIVKMESLSISERLLFFKKMAKELERWLSV